MYTKELVLSKKPVVTKKPALGRFELVQLREQHLVRYTDSTGRYTEEEFDGLEAAEKRQRELIREGIKEPEVWQVVR